MKITWLDNHRYNIPEDTAFMINELDEKQAEIDRLTLALREANEARVALRKDLEEATAQIEEAADKITELKGQHKGLVITNGILRQRPDLPLNRIPAARAVTKLYEENERLRAALAKARGQMTWLAENERECLGVVPMDDGTEVPAIFIAVSDIDAALEEK